MSSSSDDQSADDTPAPKTFISYSWDDDAHKEWVKQLATRLRLDGVDVTLDRWHSAPGHQLPEFMERAVRENDFVIAVCTPRFKEKSDARGGGVGYEGDIMTAYAFTDKDEKKFIPVLRSGDWREAAPTWLLGRVWIDLRNDPYSESAYEELLRTLHGAREQPPPIGPRPYDRLTQTLPPPQFGSRHKSKDPTPRLAAPREVPNDLFGRFESRRNWTRIWAVSLFLVAAILLAWSRSPDWRIPLPPFVNGNGQRLTLPSGLAPIFGPLPLLLFYLLLYTYHRETLIAGRLLRPSHDKSLIEPPFSWAIGERLQSLLFSAVVLVATPILTVFLLFDFLFLSNRGEMMWLSLHRIADMWGVVPEHRGSSAQVYVYGGAQAWIYLSLAIFELSLIVKIYWDEKTYGKSLRNTDPG